MSESGLRRGERVRGKKSNTPNSLTHSLTPSLVHSLPRSFKRRLPKVDLLFREVGVVSDNPFLLFFFCFFFVFFLFFGV